ncbi:MAG: Zn-dependent oligopeptidase [Candidatus Thorarchaeota archaeon]|nr:Zn-dependent oligopeptidase [Candidatus Thorarchaeota archaeon]
MSFEGIIRDIDWTIEPEMIQFLTDGYIEDTRKKIDQIAKVPEGKETLQTLLDFEESTSALGDLARPFIFLKDISTDKAQRDAGNDVEKKVLKFFNEIGGRKDLYDVFKRLDAVSDSFGPEEQMLLKRTLEDFVHRGAALADDERKEFLEISNNITVLESDYNRVYNEDTTIIPCTIEELEGVPPDVYENLERDGDFYKLTLDYPVFIPVRSYAKNPETRKKMTIAYYQRGGKENSERLSDALALRDRKAKLAGFANFADYNISIKMAKTSQRVLEFMSDLKDKLSPLAQRELRELKELKATELGLSPELVTIELWDLFYYHEMLMRERYSVDQNEIKKYFPMERVVAGVLEVYQMVLDLEFKEIDSPNAWSDDIRAFKVIDKDTGELKGVFYLDLYPREGKFKHYAVFDILNRRVKDNKVLLPIASMVSNYQKPTASKPSLLTHDEVETFFHEFGHLMHALSNSASYASFGLSGVLPDFIETPSMMFENWAWKEEVLSLLSGHYEEPVKKLPTELLKKMIAGKLLDVGLMQLRQVFFSLIDIHFHTHMIDDPDSDWIKSFTEITHIRHPEGTNPVASMAHFMGGYEAGYYGYLWSKVYAEDIFTEFEENGYMDSATGYKYRTTILAPGGSRDPEEMVREFLGREPNSDAFLKSLGI